MESGEADAKVFRVYLMWGGGGGGHLATAVAMQCLLEVRFCSR